MIQRKLLYLLLLGVNAYLMLLFDYQQFRFLFLFLLSVPFLCLLQLLAVVFSCRVQLKPETAYLLRGETGKLAVEAVNGGFFPAAAVRAAVRIRLPGEALRREKRCIRGIPGKSTGEAAIEFTACHCGQAFFQLTGAGVSDYLGLFSLPLKRRRCPVLFVMPSPEALPGELAVFLSDGRLPGAGERDGDYAVREYRPGDSPNRIHWKLSVREGELQVRDLEAGSLTLFLHTDAALRKDPERWDAWLDRAFALLNLPAAQGTELEVLWNAGESIFRRRIVSGEDASECICRLLSGNVPEEEERYAGNPAQLLEGLHLDADGALYFGEQWLYG